MLQKETFQLTIFFQVSVGNSVVVLMTVKSFVVRMAGPTPIPVPLPAGMTVLQYYSMTVCQYDSMYVCMYVCMYVGV